MREILELIMTPVSGIGAQIGTISVLVLTGLDVLAGSLSAHLHDEFSSHKLRDGLIRKVQNMLLMVGALFIDASLLGGLSLPMSPCYLGICIALIVMEVKSLLEIWNRDHPEVSGTLDNLLGDGQVGDE